MSLLKVLQFVLCTLGIYVSYLTQGIVQERLSTETFGPASERFSSMAVLSWVQGLGCFLVASLLLRLFHDHKHQSDYPPLLSYWSVGVTASLGPSFGYASLRNINYAAQVPSPFGS